MLTANIQTQNPYDTTTPKFQTAFAFLRRDDLAVLPAGWVELDHGVRASVQHYTTQSAATLKYETHEKYYDVQYLAAGQEWLGCVGRDGLIPSAPYDPLNDVTFYEAPSLTGGVLLRAGDYAIFAPGDAHQPRCQAAEPEPVIKIVVKVPA